MLLPDGASTAWRDPSGTVAVLQLPLHEDWVGRSVRNLEAATGTRVAFIVRFGRGVLPDGKNLLQADDQVYAAAVSGTVTAVTASHPRSADPRSPRCAWPSPEPARSAGPSPPS
jgi:trk system potassium uptake protein TrkA